MSERYPDEVLQRAWEEGYDLFSHELINNFEAPDRTVVVAAMRAVLEGHLAAELDEADRKHRDAVYERVAVEKKCHAAIDGLLAKIERLERASDGSPR